MGRLVVDEATVDGEEVRQDGHTGDEVLVYERLVLQLLVLRHREGRRPRRPPSGAHGVLLVVVVLLRVGLPHPAKGRQKAKQSSPHEMPRRPASINKEASG